MSFISDFEYAVRNGSYIEVLFHWGLSFVVAAFVAILFIGIPLGLIHIFIYIPPWLSITVLGIGIIGTFIYLVEDEPIDKYSKNRDE